MTKPTLNFETVEKAANNFYRMGVEPTVREVRNITSGKTETVSKHLLKVKEKRKSKILDMSETIGSSKIASLLADEIQKLIEQRTGALQQISESQELDLKELSSLIEEHAQEYSQTIEKLKCEHNQALEKVEISSTQEISNITKQLEEQSKKSEQAEMDKNDALKKMELLVEDTKKRVDSTQHDRDLVISLTEKEASALVDAAEERTNNIEQEAISLRDQVKQLSIDNAKFEVAQEQHKKTQTKLESTIELLTQERASVIKLKTQQDNHVAEVQRLSSELTEAKSATKDLAIAQGQLVELQAQISQLQTCLASVEREKETLAIALKK